MTLSLSAQLWQPDFASAQATAKEANKNLVIVFSGSDWCGPCIKLARDIWDQEAFFLPAEAAFVFYKADFPRRKANKLSEEVSATNAGLAEQYNQRGSFPLVVIVTPEGEVLGSTGYKKVSPTDYLEILQSFAK